MLLYINALSISNNEGIFLFQFKKYFELKFVKSREKFGKY